ncbi:MAG: ribosome biogenesis GTPase YlqF, partial [spirochete symbiont of Stewartia floridana]
MAAVQWFPGHMAKAKRLIRGSLPLIDVVIEVLDARAPRSSSNPLLRSLTQPKQRLILLNKDDLADTKATKLWISQFHRDGQIVPLRVSGKQARGLDAIPKACLNLFRDASWRSRRPVRALITGIPNVGKSSIINGLSGRNRAETGAAPGLTRNLRRIPINSRFELFDTPGLLLHKFEDPLTGLILAALGAVKETILPDEELTARLLSYLAWRYPEALATRYGLKEIPQPPHSLTEVVGRNRGCLM